MKSWRGQLSFAGLATVAVALLAHGCQSPEAFHMNDDDASSGTGGEDSGSGGKGSGGNGNGNGSGGSSNGSGGQGSGGITGSGGFSTGSGGHVITGTGGVGGRATGSGGNALGGHAGTAGRGAGGRAATGGAGGRAATGGAGGNKGTAGRGGAGGRTGAGGRSPFGFSDDNCITDIQTNDYAFGTAPGCSACTDNGKSLETECQAVIDCLAPQWPCTGNCLTQCYNTAGASGPVMSCVSALTTAACGM